MCTRVQRCRITWTRPSILGHMRTTVQRCRLTWTRPSILGHMRTTVQRCQLPEMCPESDSQEAEMWSGLEANTPFGVKNHVQKKHMCASDKQYNARRSV
jgi:hypothetical protein